METVMMEIIKGVVALLLMFLLIVNGLLLL